MSPPRELQPIREAIEEIDRLILTKLKERMALVDRIADSKLKQAYPFRDQGREEQVLQRVRHVAVELGLDAHGIEQLYRYILEMSIARQQAFIGSKESAPLRVSYQGVEGSYTHLAAQRRYAGLENGVLLTGFETFREAVEGVRDGSADIALLPIENTTAGSINETYDLLAEGGITINAEEISQIEHCLLAPPGTKVADLTTILSHPQALRQCDAFLRSLTGVKPVIEFDTAGAAKMLMKAKRKNVAAIASESAAKLYGLEVLRRGIQTESGNFTRFVEVAREARAIPPDARCKTSLLLRLSHRPGALGEVLTEFTNHGVNLTKLESRPDPGSPFQYLFYLDIEGHAASAQVANTLEAIGDHVSDLRVLGTYAVAEDRGQEVTPT